MDTDFKTFFTTHANGPPYNWQTELAIDDKCRNRLIHVQTGMGKTLGVLAVWLYRRVGLQDRTWPGRLVWCLPMRALVEQTLKEARSLPKPHTVSAS